MFREMRRKSQKLTAKECEAILYRGTSGVLAVHGDEEYPYAVPLSYVYSDGKIFFHCAKSGHKLDVLRSNANVSFCVIDKDTIMPEEYTSYFRSVIVFGKIRILELDSEKRNAIEKLALKYSPDGNTDERCKVIEREYAALTMLELSIYHMSGKAAIEVIRNNIRI